MEVSRPPLGQVWDERISLAIKDVMPQSSTALDLWSRLMKRTRADMPVNQMLASYCHESLALALYCYLTWLTTAAMPAAQHQHWHHTAVKQKTEWNMWENKVWKQTFLWKKRIILWHDYKLKLRLKLSQRLSQKLSQNLTSEQHISMFLCASVFTFFSFST